jgi:hypothetical protein
MVTGQGSRPASAEQRLKELGIKAWWFDAGHLALDTKQKRLQRCYVSS